jgi:hypothetical protein
MGDGTLANRGEGWIAFVGLGAYVASQKRRSLTEVVILGLLFGPIGAIVEGLLPSVSEEECYRQRDEREQCHEEFKRRMDSMYAEDQPEARRPLPPRHFAQAACLRMSLLQLKSEVVPPTTLTHREGRFQTAAHES